MLQYLAAAGVGHLQIIDFDIVSTSNLQRQVLFQTTDVGKPKARVAAERLTAINPLLTIEPVQEQITAANALLLLKLPMWWWIAPITFLHVIYSTMRAYC